MRRGNLVLGMGLLVACEGGDVTDETDDPVDTDTLGETDETDVGNTPPTVEADDVIGLAGTRVTLTARGDDADGDELAYAWTWISGPGVPDRAGAPPLQDGATATPTFRPMYAGTYVYEVVAWDGEDESEPVTVEVAVHDIEGGVQISVALKPDGSLWAWGTAPGLGTEGNADAPARVCAPGASDCDADPFEGVVQIAVGANHVLALRDDGTVWAWGEHYDGQLGDGSGTGEGVERPVQVCAVGETAPCDTFLDGVVQVAAGYWHSAALLADGRVVTWGDDRLGELGNGHPTQDVSVPVAVCEDADGAPCADGAGAVLSAVERLAAGGDGHTLALSGGSLVAWGANKNGQCGVGGIAGAQVVPGGVCEAGGEAPCDALEGVVEMDAWSSHSLAVLRDGSVWGWGSDEYGQIASEAPTSESCQNPPCHVAPVQVCPSGDEPCTDPLEGADQIAAARRFSAALVDGEVWTWGYNTVGQLGRGHTDEAPAPGRVCAPGATAPCTTFLSGVVGIATGNWHTLALREDGSLWAWGDDAGKQLGAAGDGDASVPVRVEGY